MGCELTTWRCRIGLYHGRTCGGIHIKERFYVNISLSFILMVLCFIKRCVLSMLESLKSIINTHISLIILLLLLKAGDIEINPGPEHEHCLSILHCNIRSIRHKLEYIKDSFVDFDILCFTETHLDAAVSDEFLHLSDSFDVLYRKDRTNHGGGILIYVSKNLNHERMHKLEIYSHESIWICV